jgi:hypothetical protein
MVDEANTQALRLVSSTLPTSSELLVNLQFPGEYVEEIRLHLINIWNRGDIHVDYVRMEELTGEAAGGPLYVLEAVVENQPLLTVRMGAVESSVYEWNRMLEDFLARSAVPAGRVERRLQLFNVNFIRLLCPLMPALGFCEVDEPLVDLRRFSYGWELYGVMQEDRGRQAGTQVGEAVEPCARHGAGVDTAMTEEMSRMPTIDRASTPRPVGGSTPLGWRREGGLLEDCA